MRALVTIGTDNAWAPPMMCAFEITEDFVIRNTNSVWWHIYTRGIVTRWALRWPQGWFTQQFSKSIIIGPLASPAIIAKSSLCVTFEPCGELIGDRLPDAEINLWQRICYFCKLPIGSDERAVKATRDDSVAHFSCWYGGHVA